MFIPETAIETAGGSFAGVHRETDEKMVPTTDSGPEDGPILETTGATAHENALATDHAATKGLATDGPRHLLLPRRCAPAPPSRLSPQH